MLDGAPLLVRAFRIDGIRYEVPSDPVRDRLWRGVEQRLSSNAGRSCEEQSCAIGDASRKSFLGPS